MQGTAYKILCSQGHIFIHTNNGLYFFKDMATRFLRGESLSGRNRVQQPDIDCFDFNIAFDRWLLLLDHHGINLIAIADLDHLGESSQSEDSSMNTVESDFDWEPIESINLDHSESSSLFESDLQMV